MGMPVTGFRTVLARNDPRIKGGVTQLGGDRAPNAPAPTAPLPVNTTQPVGGRTPVSAAPAGAAGPGGVASPGKPGAARGAAPSGMPKRGAGQSIGYLTRKNTTAPWLRAAQPTGSVIGG